MILTNHGHHNSSDLQPITFVDYKLITHKDKSILSETLNNENNIDIIDELVAMIQPPNQLRLSMPEPILHRISKMLMKEVVEDKKMELMQLGTKIPMNDVDV